VGGQEQFYLEGQISYALPKEGNAMHVYCSTQHPTEMQHVVAHALHYPSHAVTVECRRMGGGFGGKESQSALWAACAAVAAAKLRKPVKLRADRDDDMMVTGKRHCFYYEYEIGYDDNGLITAAKVEMVSRAGFSADLSAPVATRAVCHFDNTYYLSDVDIRAMAGKTNTQSNTRRARSASNTSSMKSRATWAWTSWTCARLTSMAATTRKAATSRNTARRSRTTSSTNWWRSWSSTPTTANGASKSMPSTPPARC
jgi:CO/xanthine dehydrogenase Mo-binding subunit